MTKQRLLDKLNELKEDSIDFQGVVEISETNTITPVDVEEIVDKINELKEDSTDTQGEGEISEANTISTVDPEEFDPNIQENTALDEEELVPVIDPENQEASFRVQIGAFSRKVSKQVFAELPDVVSVKGDDEAYRFSPDHFVDKTKATTHKVDLSTLDIMMLLLLH